MAQERRPSSPSRISNHCILVEVELWEGQVVFAFFSFRNDGAGSQFVFETLLSVLSEKTGRACRERKSFLSSLP